MGEGTLLREMDMEAGEEDTRSLSQLLTDQVRGSSWVLAVPCAAGALSRAAYHAVLIRGQARAGG